MLIEVAIILPVTFGLTAGAERLRHGSGGPEPLPPMWKATLGAAALAGLGLAVFNAR